MKKFVYALKTKEKLKKDFIIVTLCPNHLNLKDREDCEEVYHFEEDPCFKCWNEEIGEEL